MTTIAVLEDSDSLRSLLGEILGKRGYTLVFYPSIEDAQALLWDPPDLLISDINLGDGNGIDFVERMREALDESDMPQVLLLSALGSEEDMLRGFDAGADEYLTKPVSMGELLAKCSFLLARAKKRAAPAAGGEVKLPGGELAFGRYRVTSRLGSGAFGTVYDAQDVQSGTRIALKVLHALKGAEFLHRQRFLRESYTLSLVKSRHVVRLIDFGEAEGRLYAALEFVEGCTLSKAVTRGGPLQEPALLSLLSACSLALDALAAQRLVHRDIKPANVILRGGEPSDPVLIDFGLAKSSGDQMLTAEGTLLGTPAFMSPEQISAQELDFRTDQFSLGLTIRYAATGQSAFPELSGVQLLTALATQPVSFPEAMRPGLRQVLERMTHLEASRRYPSARALLRELETFAGSATG